MRVLVISPHFDDAPLSLGQSFIDGALSHHDVIVGVVFGRTNWTRWFYPTPGRAPLVSLIRRGEEQLAALRFGFRLVVGDAEEAILRTGELAPESILDPAFDADGAPVTDDAVAIVSRWLGTAGGSADVVLAPLGLGDHVDHRIANAAARRLAATGTPVAFYEDRPYACTLGDEEIDAIVRERRSALARHDVSGPITSAKHRRVWYPSQLDDFFHTAMRLDEDLARRERIWAPRDAGWVDELVAPTAQMRLD